jgi:hypothetical protein
MLLFPIGLFFIDRSEGTQHQPNFYERQAMLSEYSSGLDPAPAKKMKVRPTSAAALEMRNPC